MPWYWSDDLVATLTSSEIAESSGTTRVVAYWHEAQTIEEAAAELAEEGEIPLAA